MPRLSSKLAIAREEEELLVCMVFLYCPKAFFVTAFSQLITLRVIVLPAALVYTCI